MIGFDPVFTDIIVKFFYHQYNIQLDLIDESLNTIHKWHQLIHNSVKHAKMCIYNDENDPSDTHI